MTSLSFFTALITDGTTGNSSRMDSSGENKDREDNGTKGEGASAVDSLGIPGWEEVNDLAWTLWTG